MSDRIKNGVIVMTALPPTEGHLALIEWAGHFLRSDNDGRHECGQLFVIVNGRSFEPALNVFHDRTCDIRATLRKRGCDYNINVIWDECDEAPQNPSEHPDFWNWWKDRILGCATEHRWDDDGDGEQSAIQPGDYLFASESYGHELAKVMGLNFVPFDMKREIVPAKATDVRQSMIEHWDQLIPHLKREFRKRITIFGAESCGKTTMTKRLAEEFRGLNGQALVTALPEWARPYLEEVGAEVTPEKMEIIMRGQWALQTMFNDRVDTPFLVQDTDLLSTIGYYKIMGLEMPDEMEELAFDLSQSHLYIVMNSNIPFEQDPLRYGGDKRESSDQFWIDILEQYGMKYHVVKATDPDLQFAEVCQAMFDAFNTELVKALRTFERT